MIGVRVSRFDTGGYFRAVCCWLTGFVLLCGSAQADARGPGPPEPTATKPSTTEPATGLPESPRELLELYGVDESHFNKLRDGEPLSAAEEEIILKVIFRVRDFSPANTAQWLRPDVGFDRLLSEPSEHRGELFPLVGRVLESEAANPPAEVVDRYQIRQYYRCRVQLAADGPPAVVITSRVPKPLRAPGPLEERVSAAGLFLKVAQEGDQPPALVFVAPRLAWHPDRLNASEGVNLGMTILGDLGMDVGQLDLVKNQSRITKLEREAFYQMLSAVGKAGANQLIRQAQENLPQRTKAWNQEIATLGSEVERLRTQLASDTVSADQREQLRREADRKHKQRLIAELCVQAAKQGKYSVFPLFNQADTQHGQLVVLEGNVRRAMLVQVGTSGARHDGNLDILQRMGIDHYYELEMFTEDSENNPIVFCVRELPKGFPAGERINEMVRVAGFFFKSWAYYTQQPGDFGPDGRLQKKQQLAPLLIGKAPIWLQSSATPRNPYLGLMAGGLFIVALIGVWLTIWRYTRADQEFHARTIASRYEMAEGVSLNELGLDAEAAPDFRHLHDQEDGSADSD